MTTETGAIKKEWWEGLTKLELVERIKMRTAERDTALQVVEDQKMKISTLEGEINQLEPLLEYSKGEVAKMRESRWTNNHLLKNSENTLDNVLKSIGRILNADNTQNN